MRNATEVSLGVREDLGELLAKSIQAKCFAVWDHLNLTLIRKKPSCSQQSSPFNSSGYLDTSTRKVSSSNLGGC